MIEKNRMHDFANIVVAAEGKRKVAHSAAYFGIRQIGFDPFHGFDEIDGIVAMFFQPCGNGQYVGIEDDVFRLETVAGE